MGTLVEVLGMSRAPALAFKGNWAGSRWLKVREEAREPRVSSLEGPGVVRGAMSLRLTWATRDLVLERGWGKKKGGKERG